MQLLIRAQNIYGKTVRTLDYTVPLSTGVYHYHVYNHCYADGSNGINESGFHLLQKVNVGGLVTEVKSLAHSLTVNLSVTCQSSHGQRAAVM